MIRPEAVPVSWVVRRAVGDGTAPLPAAETWVPALDDLSENRLLPLALHCLGTDAERVPQKARLAMVAATALAARQVAQSRGQLAELASRLDPAGVTWLVLKGLPLAQRLYPRPELRPSGDIDLLVSRRDAESSGATLEALGYRGEGGFDWTFHHRRYARPRGPEEDVVELHWATDPPGLAAPPTEALLHARVPFEFDGLRVWIPAPADERDLLVRHLARHAGGQAILLVDLLLHPLGRSVGHPLGALVGDDLARLGLARLIDGPDRYRLRPLRRWMAARTYRERLRTRPIAIKELWLSVALAQGPTGLLHVIRRHLWPDEPPQRWRVLAASPGGARTWRWRRLARFGR